MEQINQKLQKYIDLVSVLTGKNTVMERIIPLMEYLDNPQEKLKVIHVAGTSGKTSTCYYIASLLKEDGIRCGLTVSPHIDSITERIQIDLEPIKEDVFIKEINQFIDLVEESEITPSYFELLYAFAIWYFAKIGLDYAVVETGMGGLYDATNVIKNPNKICVITDIGLDHTNILGNTIKEIAHQKAGIIHRNNHLIMYKQADEIMSVVKDRILKEKASFQFLVQEEISLENDLLKDLHKLPLFQRRNFLLAYKIIDYLIKRDGLNELSTNKIMKAMDIKIPARMDKIVLNNKTIIMDGAHNPQKNHHLVESYKDKYPGVSTTLIISFKDSKDYRESIDELIRISDEIIITKFSTTMELPSKAVEPRDIATYLENKEFNNFKIRSIDEVIPEILANKNTNILITGSFYLIAEIRRKLK